MPPRVPRVALAMCGTINAWIGSPEGVLAVVVPVSMVYVLACFADPTQRPKEQGHGQVGDRFGEHARRIGDPDAAPRCRLDVNMVIAHTEVGHYFERGACSNTCSSTRSMLVGNKAPHPATRSSSSVYASSPPGGPWSIVKRSANAGRPRRVRLCVLTRRRVSRTHVSARTSTGGVHGPGSEKEGTALMHHPSDPRRRGAARWRTAPLRKGTRMEDEHVDLCVEHGVCLQPLFCRRTTAVV